MTTRSRSHIPSILQYPFQPLLLLPSPATCIHKHCRSPFLAPTYLFRPRKFRTFFLRLKTESELSGSVMPHPGPSLFRQSDPISFCLSKLRAGDITISPSLSMLSLFTLCSLHIQPDKNKEVKQRINFFFLGYVSLISSS